MQNRQAGKTVWCAAGSRASCHKSCSQSKSGAAAIRHHRSSEYPTSFLRLGVKKAECTEKMHGLVTTETMRRRQRWNIWPSNPRRSSNERFHVLPPRARRKVLGDGTGLYACGRSSSAELKWFETVQKLTAVKPLNYPFRVKGFASRVRQMKRRLLRSGRGSSFCGLVPG
jgi:hypothetical protein